MSEGLPHPLLEELTRSGALPPDRVRAIERGIVDAHAGGAPQSRALYDARPFVHVRRPEDEPEFVAGMSPLARRVVGEIPRGALVLEVGSGPGHVTALLRRRTDRVVALDQSVVSLRRLRASVDAAAVVADAQRLPFADGTFDAVVADGVLHHAASPRRAFREAVRVLAPGGRLFVRMYRAEGRYPAVHRTVGAMLRAAEREPFVRPVVWRVVAPLYRTLADRRDRRRGRPRASHDEGVFSDYFLTPHATPVTRRALRRWIREAGLEVLEYEAWGNVHGILARRPGGSRAG
jgi:SAM-dependent methyltransferase